jgi:thiol-disulfide isomerase/thioredoxin
VDLLWRAVALTAVVAVAVAAGLWRRRTDGRLRVTGGGETLDAAALRAPLGSRATLVQFSTEFCQPCRAARRVLAAAATAPGVAHVEVDATERGDLVDRFGVRRTPTLLVLDPGGRVVRRASGVPSPGELADALAAAGAR